MSNDCPPCLDNITNYHDLNNAIRLPNDLTATFTYDFNVALQTISFYDMSFLKAGETITSLTAKATDLGGTVTATVATDSATLDVSGLNLNGSVRLDYTITTSLGRTNAAPPTFFDATKDEESRLSSDPNRLPLREQTTSGGVFGEALIYEHIQAVAAAIWTVTHNTGVLYPASQEVYNAANARMMTGWIPTDANTLTIGFGGVPTAGRAYFIFKKP